MGIRVRVSIHDFKIGLGPFFNLKPPNIFFPAFLAVSFFFFYFCSFLLNRIIFEVSYFLLHVAERFFCQVATFQKLLLLFSSWWHQVPPHWSLSSFFSEKLKKFPNQVLPHYIFDTFGPYYKFEADAIPPISTTKKLIVVPWKLKSFFQNLNSEK